MLPESAALPDATASKGRAATNERSLTGRCSATGPDHTPPTGRGSPTLLPSLGLGSATQAPEASADVRRSELPADFVPADDAAEAAAAADASDLLDKAWPEEWRPRSERVHCIVVDVDLSAAVSANWEMEPWSLTVEADVRCLPRPLVQLALKAFVLRARARCWLHVRRKQLRIALHEGERLAEFKSFAELGLCGCCCGGAAKGTAPDLAGITSRIMRHYLLTRLTARTPIELDLPQGAKGRGGKDGQLRWTSTVTGTEYKIPIPCEDPEALPHELRNL